MRFGGKIQTSVFKMGTGLFNCKLLIGYFFQKR